MVKHAKNVLQIMYVSVSFVFPTLYFCVDLTQDNVRIFLL